MLSKQESNMRKYRYSKEELQKIVAESVCLKEVMQKMGIVARGGNYKTIRNKIKEFELCIKHFTGQAHNKGKKHPEKRRPIEDYLNNNQKIGTHALKLKLLKAKIFEPICSNCKNTEWMGNPIPLELDHIDGNNEDNLRLLCPNCHAQTDTYRGKNKSKLPLRELMCKECNKPFQSNNVNRQTCSNECKHKAYYKQRVETESKNNKDFKPKKSKYKIKWPTKEEILERLKTISCKTLAKELGVSANSIRVHLKR